MKQVANVGTRRVKAHRQSMDMGEVEREQSWSGDRDPSTLLQTDGCELQRTLGVRPRVSGKFPFMFDPKALKVLR